MTLDPNGYGIAVRAGAITPQIEDEEIMRKAMGLPAMSAAARELWATQKVREPITLRGAGAQTDTPPQEENPDA